ncbi:MAG TPA: RNA methyltransferase [Firmicutes bacterium]|nr:RNA methyltransferase [Bacillota bacterium]
MSEFLSSKDNKKIKEALSCRDGKGDFFLVEGFHMVEMAVEKASAVRIFSLKEYPHKNIEFYLTNETIIKRLSFSKTPEGIVALCEKKREERPFSEAIVYLDELQDPGNVGTILRTCLAFGYRDVFLSKGCASAYSPKTLSSSQGAIFKLNIKEGNSVPEEDILSLKEKGYKILATDLKSSFPLKELSIEKPYVLVLGNEGKGVNPRILSLSDKKVRIEMEGIDSLNVGVAAGILLYELKKK